jgi:hypothetical protein
MTDGLDVVVDAKNFLADNDQAPGFVRALRRGYKGTHLSAVGNLEVDPIGFGHG